MRKRAPESEIPHRCGANRIGTTRSPVFASSCVFLKATPNGDKDAFRYRVQQLGNGAIVEKLISGRSFSDGRARGEGSKGYVVIRDARIKSLEEFGSGQRSTEQSVGMLDRETPMRGK